jgi:hypothetical protein
VAIGVPAGAPADAVFVAACGAGGVEGEDAAAAGAAVGCAATAALVGVALATLVGGGVAIAAGAEGYAG